MIDMRMFMQRTVLFTNITAVFTGFAMFGAFVLLPSLMQTPSGRRRALRIRVVADPHRSLSPSGRAPRASSRDRSPGVSGTRYGSRLPLVLGMILASIGIGLLALYHAHPWQISIWMVAIGIGVPFAFAAMAKLIVDAVRPSETGVATGMNTVMRTVGSVLGGQVGAAIVSADTITHTHVPGRVRVRRRVLGERSRRDRRCRRSHALDPALGAWWLAT